jgi:hypothetical protein
VALTSTRHRTSRASRGDLTYPSGPPPPSWKCDQRRH